MKLNEANIQTIQKAVTAVLETGKAWGNDSIHFPAGCIIEAVEELGLVTQESEEDNCSNGFSTNGWQWDWWQRFKAPNGKLYVLSGSGFYGGHGFHLADEQ